MNNNYQQPNSSYNDDLLFKSLQNLAPSLKMSILNQLDSHTKAEVLKIVPDNDVKPLKFMDKFSESDLNKNLKISQSDLIKLECDGYFIIDNFIDDFIIEQSISEIDSIRNAGKLLQAGLSQSNNSRWVDKSIRGDYNIWFNDSLKSENINLGKIFDKIQTLQNELNLFYKFQSNKIEVFILFFISINF